MKRLVSIALYILSLFVIVQQFVYPANIAMHFAPQAADSGPSGLKGKFLKNRDLIKNR